jgi:hypothetical protein
MLAISMPEDTGTGLELSVTAHAITEPDVPLSSSASRCGGAQTMVGGMFVPAFVHYRSRHAVTVTVTVAVTVVCTGSFV